MQGRTVMTQRTGQDLCLCFPPWLKKHLSVDEDKLTCAGCLEKVVRTTEYSCLRQFIGYPCFHKRDRIHVLSIIFHNDHSCTSEFAAEMRETEREKLFECAPFHHLISRETVLSKHKLTGLQCAHCGTAEQTHCKLLNCSRCKHVRYCNSDCQVAHYTQHKEFCFAKARGIADAAAAAQKKQEQEDIGERCSCFNEEDACIYNQTAKNECSAKNCHVKIGGPVQFGFFATTCTLPLSRRKEPMHMIPTAYCSDGCMKKSVNPKN